MHTTVPSVRTHARPAAARCPLSVQLQRFGAAQHTSCLRASGSAASCAATRALGGTRAAASRPPACGATAALRAPLGGEWWATTLTRSAQHSHPHVQVRRTRGRHGDQGQGAFLTELDADLWLNALQIARLSVHVSRRRTVTYLTKAGSCARLEVPPFARYALQSHGAVQMQLAPRRPSELPSTLPQQLLKRDSYQARLPTIQAWPLACCGWGRQRPCCPG